MLFVMKKGFKKKCLKEKKKKGLKRWQDWVERRRRKIQEKGGYGKEKKGKQI